MYIPREVKLDSKSQADNFQQSSLEIVVHDRNIFIVMVIVTSEGSLRLQIFSYKPIFHEIDSTEGMKDARIILVHDVELSKVPATLTVVKTNNMFI